MNRIRAWTAAVRLLLLLLLIQGALAACSDDATSPPPPTPGPTVWQVPGDWPTIAAAADTARAGDVIELAAGVYREHDLAIEAGVDLRGATGRFADVVIDGQGLGRVLTVAPDTVSEAHDDTVSVISGLTIRGGNADGSGGGLSTRAEVVVRGCRFAANMAAGPGSGVAVIVSNATFAHCVFDSNGTATWDEVGGGIAMALFDDQRARVDTCVFNANFAQGAGGALHLAGPVSVTGSTFVGNRAFAGGAAAVAGEVVISGCLFEANEAVEIAGNGDPGHGGAIYHFGRAQTVSGCEFRGNSALLGSAVYGFTTGSYRNCSFDGNVAAGTGTVYWVGARVVDFRECDFTANNAEYGAGFFAAADLDLTFTDCLFDRNAAGAGGAGIFRDAGIVTLNGCTVTDNTSASNGGAFAALDFAFDKEPYLVLNDCVVTGNTAELAGGAVFMGVASVLSATGTLFADNTAPEYDGGYFGPGAAATLTCCERSGEVFGGPGTVTVEDEGCGR